MIDNNLLMLSESLKNIKLLNYLFHIYRYLYKKGHFYFNTVRLICSFNRDRYYQTE
jgi:hypothetical protein